MCSDRRKNRVRGCGQKKTKSVLAEQHQSYLTVFELEIFLDEKENFMTNAKDFGDDEQDTNLQRKNACRVKKRYDFYCRL